MTDRTGGRPGPRITYDPTVDAMAIELVAGARHATTLRVRPGLLVHLDERKRPVEIELLDASTVFSAAELAAIRSPAEWLTLREAAAASGLAPATLRLLVNKGRIRAERRGRDWLVTRAALENYLDDRKPAGRPARDPRARRATKASA